MATAASSTPWLPAKMLMASLAIPTHWQVQAERDRVKTLEAENQQILDAINSDIASAKAEQEMKEKENARIQNEIKKIFEEQAKDIVDTYIKTHGRMVENVQPQPKQKPEKPETDIVQRTLVFMTKR